MAGEDEPQQPVKPPGQGSHGNKGIPVPRQLSERESHQDITAWEVSVKNFYRKDETYYPFVNAKLKWSAASDHYGMIDEHGDSKLKRDKEEMGEDLLSFLQIMAGYVPGDHLWVKIEQDSVNFKSVIQIIREFYDSEINTESSLDLMKMQKKAQEPHRQFFEHLASHGREHMVPANKTVGSIKSPDDKPESMTLTLLNVIAQIWLEKTDPRLTDIVKKEFGAQLQQGKLLYELVPDIAKNIDTFLKKADSGAGAIGKVSTKKNNLADSVTGTIKMIQEGFNSLNMEENNLDETDLEEMQEMSVNTVRKIFDKNRGRKFRDSGSNSGSRGKGRNLRDSWDLGQQKEHLPPL